MYVNYKEEICCPTVNWVTYDVRAVPSVNQDLVVGVGLPLHLLGAVGSWGLRFARGKEEEPQKGS